jgi:hypothetical protein
MNVPARRTIWLLLPLLAGLLGAARVTQGPVTHSKARFAATLPVGWVMDMRGHTLSASRDGFNVQIIQLSRRDLKDAFPAQELSASADMDLEQLGELFVAEAKRQNENVEIQSTEPAVLGGRDAVRAEWSFATPNGLRFRVIAFIMTTPDGVFEVWYKAPALHYFERDRAAFEAVVASFKYDPELAKSRQR